MFILQLNDIRTPVEQLTPVARAETAEELFGLMDQEKAEFYDDMHLGNPCKKAFRRSGPLEWFNPPKGEVHDKDQPYIMSVGSEEDWVEMARKDYRERVIGLPEAKKMGIPEAVQL